MIDWCSMHEYESPYVGLVMRWPVCKLQMWRSLLQTQVRMVSNRPTSLVWVCAVFQCFVKVTAMWNMSVCISDQEKQALKNDSQIISARNHRDVIINHPITQDTLQERCRPIIMCRGTAHYHLRLRFLLHFPRRKTLRTRTHPRLSKQNCFKPR